MAGGDSNCKFLMFDCNFAGSTQDVLAWSLTDEYYQITNGKLPKEFYVIDDEAFTNTEQILSPWPGRGLAPWKDSVNYHLSSMRQCIERAFGLLTQRWGVYWRPLRCSFYKRTLVLSVCAKLHNFCIDMKDSDPTTLMRRCPEDTIENDVYLVLNNDPENEAFRQFQRELRQTPRLVNAQRDTITSFLQQQGYRRPLYAMPNSKA